MNIRLKKKIQQRLIDLEQQADKLNSQIVGLQDYKSIEKNLEREDLQFQLNDTIMRIKHINAANRKFSVFE